MGAPRIPTWAPAASRPQGFQLRLPTPAPNQLQLRLQQSQDLWLKQRLGHQLLHLDCSLQLRQPARGRGPDSSGPQGQWLA
eukprot:4832340-Pyramimonas_sp.AAC.1